MNNESPGALGQAAIRELMAKVKRRLADGETPDEIRMRTETRLAGRLERLSADDPMREVENRAAALHQRAIEQAIQEWEAKR